MTYTDQQLLDYAYRMLIRAKEDQINPAPGRRDGRWLLNNVTLATIQARVNEIRSKRTA